MISKKFIITGIALVIAAVLVLVALGIWLGSVIMGKSGTESALSPYSVVYLADGEIYFGKLSWFPKPHISDPWTVQRTTDKDNKVQTSIIEVNKAVWSPADELYLNEKQIMAWSALRADGDMAKLLANPQAAQQQQQQAGQVPAASQSTGSFKGPSTEPPAVK